MEKLNTSLLRSSLNAIVSLLPVLCNLLPKNSLRKTLLPKSIRSLRLQINFSQCGSIEYTVIFRQYKLRFVGSDGVQRLSYVWCVAEYLFKWSDFFAYYLLNNEEFFVFLCMGCSFVRLPWTLPNSFNIIGRFWWRCAGKWGRVGYWFIFRGALAVR